MLIGKGSFHFNATNNTLTLESSDFVCKIQMRRFYVIYSLTIMYLFHTKRYSVTENVSQHKSGPVKSTD